MTIDLNYGDMGRLLQGYSRTNIAVDKVAAGSTENEIKVKRGCYFPGQLDFYFIQFITGDLAEQYFRICGNEEGKIEVRPEMDPLPQEDDVFSIIDNPSRSVKNGLYDEAGRQAQVASFGDLITGSRLADISMQFQYNISSHDVKTSSVDSGSVNHENRMAVVSSGTDPTGSATLTSRRSVRYRPGHDAFIYFTAKFTVTGSPGEQQGIPDSFQYIGLKNEDRNGIVIGFDGENFGIHRFRAGTQNTTLQSDFNLDTLDGKGLSAFTIDFSKLNVFRISYGWLGASTIIFEVLTPKGVWTPFHKIEYPNTEPIPSFDQPSLPFRMEVEKTAGDTVVELSTASVSGGAIGIVEREASNRLFAARNTKSLAGGTLTNLLTIRSKDTYQGLENQILSKLTYLTGAQEGNQQSSVRLIKNATLGGTPNYQDISTENSVMEVDFDGTTVTGGDFEFQITLGAKGGELKDLTDDLIRVFPGDTLTVAGYSGQSASVEAAIRWKELF